VKIEAKPGGAIVLSGSVMNEAAKRWAVELVESTTGVTSVVDELAVVKNVKVYETKTDASVVEVTRPITMPAESKIIIKP
jgi:hyperosmotically inducible periplasmic protein